jgi:acetyl-CoA C-acetyltransferase
LNALLMRRYMHEYGWEHAAFAPFSITAHQNAVNNPFARLKDEISITDYTQARMVADPVNLLDASPIGDGAAAVLLVPAEDFASMSSNPQVDVIASAASTDRIAIHDRRDPLWLSAAEKSAKMAYTQAGAAPDAVDIFELHDAFTIITALSLEACGFAKRGSGPRLGLNGEISLEGRIPISTAGGLKARGHPVGATGIYQIVEVTLQLRGDAGENQVDPARIGMAQNIGGSGATVITHILEKQ